MVQHDGGAFSCALQLAQAIGDDEIAGIFRGHVESGTGRVCVCAGQHDVLSVVEQGAGELHRIAWPSRRCHSATAPLTVHDGCIEFGLSLRVEHRTAPGVEMLAVFQQTNRQFDGVQGG